MILPSARSSPAKTNAHIAPDAGLREARLALLNAEDQLNAARSAAAGLTAEIAPLVRSLEQAEQRVSEMAKSVVAVEVKEWPHQAMQLYEHFVAHMASLHFLVREGILEDDDLNGYDGRPRPNDPKRPIGLPARQPIHAGRAGRCAE